MRISANFMPAAVSDYIQKTPSRKVVGTRKELLPPFGCVKPSLVISPLWSPILCPMARVWDKN